MMRSIFKICFFTMVLSICFAHTSDSFKLRKLKRLSNKPPQLHHNVVLSPHDNCISDFQNIVVAENIDQSQWFAKGLGYIVGIGAMALYSPIIYNILNCGDVNGLSIQTWILNLTGVSLAISYPFRKKFPISTYVELIAIVVQCMTILGLICYYQGNFILFTAGMGVYAAIMSVILFVGELSSALLSALQVAALVVCNSSNIPQIVLTFQTGRTSWSWITSCFSITGCLIRIFTTLKLTKDPLALSGYLFGLLTNTILLGQIAVYGKSSSPH